MTEAEYIIATNRVKVTAAIRLIQDMMGGDDYAVSDAELSGALGVLYKMESKLFAAIKLEEK